jgi:hypothetical protein
MHTAMTTVQIQYAILFAFIVDAPFRNQTPVSSAGDRGDLDEIAARVVLPGDGPES